MTAVFALLGRVPFLLWPLLAALVWGGVGHHKAGAIAARWELAKAQQAIEARRDEALARAEERRREVANEGVRNALAKDLEDTRRRAAADAGIAGQLRDRIAAIAAGRAVPGHAGAGPADEATARLAAVAGQCVARLAQVVEAARRATAAGGGCERSYDALTPAR